MIRHLVGFLFFPFLIGCGNSQTKEMSLIDKEQYLIMGDSIASHAQKVLLQNVSQAIKEKGAAGAVDFCNEKAMVLTDSISAIHAASIQRLSDKNRNPKNILLENIDKQAWDSIALLMQNKEQIKKHWLTKENNAIYYYKAIPIGMPTCLSCHGNKEVDIAQETMRQITTRYPNDKATGYQMGQLRGIWKIKLNF